MADLEQSLTETCTMAIVMLAAFHPERLPGVPPSRVFALTDVASYNDAWNAVKQVMNNCISKYLAVNETVPESGGGMKFISQTGWSEFGTLHLHLQKSCGKAVANMGNVLQEIKVILVSSCGIQVQEQIRRYTVSTSQLTAFDRAPRRCN